MAESVKRIARGKLNNDTLEKEIDNILKQLNGILETQQNNILNLQNGVKWYSGKTAPNNNLGKDGDFYLDEVTKTIYKKVNGKLVMSEIGKLSNISAVINDEIESAETTYSSEKVVEMVNAPDDGKQYARVNNTWVEIEAGSGNSYFPNGW